MKLQPLNISWSKTKKNVEQIISTYVYYNLSVDNSSTSFVNDTFTFSSLDINSIDNKYTKIDTVKQKRRIDFVNYFRFSFNKLTTDEKKIIYWTYLDKENNYDDRYIANNLGFSLGYYYIKKKETIIRFAYCLGAEEFNDKKC